MSKDLSDMYYKKKNEERIQKKSHERYWNLSEKEKNRKKNMVANDIKIRKWKTETSWI